MKLSPQQISEIADQIDFGFDCFIHIQTHEIIIVPSEIHLGFADLDDWQEQIDQVEAAPGDYIKIEKPSSFDSFKFMRNFAMTVEDSNIKDKIFEILEQKKPFRKFKDYVENLPGYRQKWFDFKKTQLEEWVENDISLKTDPDLQ